MVNMSNITAGLMLGLVVTSAVLPASAASRGHHPGHNARAQAIEQSVEGGVSPDRARALRECNGKVGGMREYTWGVYAAHQYRQCMTEHGQAE